MQRPVMNPEFVEFSETTTRWATCWAYVVRGAKWFGRSLMTNPLAAPKPDQPVRAETPARVLVRVAVSWAILLPSICVLSAFYLVTTGTHPAPPPELLDPNSQGCYFETVEFASGDGTKLTGWLVPAMDARRVLSEKDKVLKAKRPAVVLVHDVGQSPQQMLPLIRPLHDEGVNVLAVSLRGCGTGTARASGATFGLRESSDVAAAVELLRQMRFVDPNRVAVVGIGTGANAALMAASKDPSCKAVVIANPVKSCDDVIARRIAPHGRGLGWMQSVCRVTFELMYKVNADELDYDRYASVLSTRPSLVFDTGNPYVLSERKHVAEVRMFCRKTLGTQDRPAIGSAR